MPGPTDLCLLLEGRLSRRQHGRGRSLERGGQIELNTISELWVTNILRGY